MRKGKKNPFYGKKHSEETKRKMSKWTRKHNANRQYGLKPISVCTPNVNDLHYLAGMIDADGSIRFSKGRPFVAVYNSNKKLMSWLINTVGGRGLSEDKRGREVSYTWRIGATKDVYILCKMLEPILIVKKKDAKTALTFLDKKYGKRL